MTKENYKTSTSSPFSRTEMNTVSHVAHIETAVEILRTGCIKSSLVFDESKLNTRRIKVIWLSPNDWKDKGFIYGIVRFQFDINTLFSEDKKLNFYWVEDMPKYKPTACRILVTKNTYDDLDLEPYTLTNEEEGIWWYDKENNKHYFNGNYTLEIMYEVEDIEVKEHKNIDIVLHNKEHCNMKKKLDNEVCLEQTYSAKELVGARFLAALLLNNLKNSKINTTKISKKNQISLVGVNFPMSNKILEKLKEDILKNVPSCSTELKEVANKSLFHAVLNCYSLAQITEMTALCEIFNNKEKFKEILNNAIKNLFTKSFKFNIDSNKYEFTIINYFSITKFETQCNYVYILAHVKYKKLEEDLNYGDIEFYYVDCLSKGSVLIEAVNKVKKDKSLTNVNAVFILKIEEDIDIFKEKIIKKIAKEQKSFSV